jgi:hypothetical protein
MRKSIAARAGAGVVVGGLLLGGCYPYQLINSGNPLAAFIVVMSWFRAKPEAKALSAAKPPKPKKGRLDIPLTGEIGGLSGEYTIGLDTYGTFSGTATIGRDNRSAKLKVVDTPELLQTVTAMIVAEFGEDVSITTATAKVTGRQTAGGVKKLWNGTISFKGTVLSGPNQGLGVKGKFKSKGNL